MTLNDVAANLSWIKHEVKLKKDKESNRPGPRSCHTLTVVGSNAFLFGGLLENGDSNGTDQESGAIPTNEIFNLRLNSNSQMEWSRVKTTYPKPLPRWRHSATVFKTSQIFIFGGYHASDHRLNDVWIFDTVSYGWIAPNSAHNDEAAVPCQLTAPTWSYVPSPRAGHSATLVGSTIYIFGGYGGPGYSRRDLDDLYAFNTLDMNWVRVQAKGVPPERRSGHQACAIKNRIYIFGGSNSSTQFNDVYVLDTEFEQPIWSKLQTTLPYSVWNHAACSVIAIPSWKIFTFGGVSGNLSEHDRRGQLVSSTFVIDTGINRWTMPELHGIPPLSRSDTSIGFDSKGSRLIIFGGWSNRWLSDVYTLDVGDIVGPPYAITDMFPKMGPVTGGTEITIIGVDFFNTSQTVVRFGSMGNCVDVQGKVISPTKISCTSPEYTKYLPGNVDVRIALGEDSFTTTSQSFYFFSVSSAFNSIMYGPGLISGCKLSEEVSFIIQARDAKNINRTTGGDEYRVVILQLGKGTDAAPDEEAEDVRLTGVRIEDLQDGRYVVTYCARKLAKYQIEVEFLGTFGGIEGYVRGSGTVVEFDPGAPRENNLIAGKLVVEALKSDVFYLQKFTDEMISIIFGRLKDDRWSSVDHIRVLTGIKEALLKIEEVAVETTLLVDRSECIVHYLRDQNILIHGIEDSLTAGKSNWQRILREAPIVQAKIAPLMRSHAGKIRQDIMQYEGHLNEYKDALSNSAFYLFDTGANQSHFLLNEADAKYAMEKETCEKIKHIAEIFECAGDIQYSLIVLKDIEQLLKDFRVLWNTVTKCIETIEEIKVISWCDVDPEILEDIPKSLVASLRRLPKSVKDADASKGLDKIVKEFATTCPIIISLRSPAMRPRHWREVTETVKTSFTLPTEDDSVMLRTFFDIRLHVLASEVDDIVDKAAKEEKHEKILNSVKETWDKVSFSMTLYKETDVPLLKLTDEEVEQLEADQMAVQSILSSRFVFFKTEGTEWMHTLSLISDVTLLMKDVLRTWSYLEPLFIGSDEVKKELPEDAARFEEINRKVQTILQKAWKIKSVKSTCVQPGLLASLKEIEASLEICKKSLSEFLDRKRKEFPRFYFMSEADLLDLLSNSSQPKKVLMQIDKILLATKEILIEKNRSQDRPSATSFLSNVGDEIMHFDPPVRLKGKAEAYLLLLLNAQMIALSRALSTSIQSYAMVPRTEWVIQKNTKNESIDPAQIILLVAQMMFANQVEEGMDKAKGGDQRMMDKVFDKCCTQLAELINVTQSPLSKGDRQRVMCMITLDAHNRDIIDTLLREKALSASDFQWQSKLRPKYGGERKASTSGVSSNAEFHICGAKFDYGFEYLGNGPRLVVTPLTDRIYVTATQALNLKMGCAPAGPAGTGKTETTKDLASALGKCCYVFNCSPEMDYQSMGNIFKGLSSSGSWGCFDEFNRLIPEVLSVCSVQFKAVCDSLRMYDASKVNAQKVTIEGDTVGLDPTVGIFITMNPGYLGRSELPEGLKALFRPITVIVPDLVLICENMLMAEGFLNAKLLASKFYGLYSLLSALLSKQSHYDWGLRAVKSVLVVAGQLRRNEPSLDEVSLLMRALRDFNVPKIVQADEAVFFGLLNDLFPGLNPTRVFDESLSDCLTHVCEEKGMWPDAFFCLKVLQLDELLDIRHCVFIMGPPGAGKTSCWKMLQAARNYRQPNNKVKTVDLNPKVLPTEDLYGYISMATREWKDGLLSSIMRDLGRIPTESPKWIILDGDLDANWVESINSVMDDNKVLTLASNERIPLKHYMRMIFEIRDLKYATPATVSRAGIIYISTDNGNQWRNIIGSWIRSRPDDLLEDVDREKLHTMFENFLPDFLRFFTTSLKSVVHCNDISLCISVLRSLDTILTRSVVLDTNALETAFVFALIWGFGSYLTVSDDGTDNRKMFSDWFRNKFKAIRIPSRDTIFDYWLDPKTSKFESWNKCPVFKTVEFDSSTMDMRSITVPTVEIASIAFWVGNLVEKGFHVMLAGNAGTGKTQLVNGILQELNAEFFSSVTVNMNYYTSASVLLSSLEAPLQKRTGSTYGPPGSIRMVYFVDDLNLPEVDTYGTQSAIALLRQHIDYGHWYDTNKLTMKTVDDCQYVSALNPTAGSFAIDPRLQRHFATFAVGMPTATSLLTIYQTFLDGHFVCGGFKSSMSSISSTLIKGALSLHKDVSDSFKKTAVNFHYEFNMRHLVNVFQGLLVATADIFDSPEKFVHLWLHESKRVYADRLVDAADLDKFELILQSQARKAFPAFNVSNFFRSLSVPQPDPLIFCHFADGKTQMTVDEALVYDQAFSLADLRITLETALSEYNELNANMNLVLFEDAVLHIARIIRIIRQTGGHALLVGVGGSGKQSLSRLAAHICRYTVMVCSANQSYSLYDFKLDLQAMYQRAAVKQEGVLFLLNDSQISNEKFFIYINDLLSSGEIPDLYNRDEKDSIIGSLTSKAKMAGYSSEPSAVWRYFIAMIKKNLHCCLCFSPVGGTLRTRARRFPAIANCTVIDWFQPWPDIALASVGRKLLADIELGSPEIIKAIEEFIPAAFVAVSSMCHVFAKAEGAYVYTTPKSYLEMLHHFQTMLAKKRAENDAGVFRLRNGVQKLEEAAADVVNLEANLKLMLVAAEEKRVIAEAIAVSVAKEKNIVEAENEKAIIEEKKVAVIQAEVTLKQADATKDLELAEPSLIRAMSALDSLDRRDLGNCKTMAKTPPGVDDIFGAVMILLAGINPNIIVQKSGRVREKERTWDFSKKALLGNVNAFLDELKNFKSNIDEGSVPEINWREVRPFLQLEHFQPEIIEKRNSSAAGLCAWVINIVAYYDIVLQVEPKRVALRAANEQLSKANEQLRLIRHRVAELQARLDVLTEEFNAADSQMKEAETTAARGKIKLELAHRLISALGSESVRWGQGVKELDNKRSLLVGDCLLASAFVSYVGPFSKRYRERLMSETLVPLLSLVPMTTDSDALSLLCSAADVAEYQTQGLPADKVSAENAAILLNSSRYVLMVDPQLQALHWLKQREGKSLKVGNPGQKELIDRILEAVESGSTFLIENMGEQISPTLMPIIGRNTVKRNKRSFIQIGDREVEANPNFRLYFHTKLSSPHYRPEIQAELTVVNFSVTEIGLEEQLLSIAVKFERSDLAAQNSALLLQQNLFLIKLKKLEDEILERLADAVGDITEDRSLIESLELSKKLSNEIAIQLDESKVNSDKINITAEKYRPVARRGALLFFIMNKLHKVHTYYMYSLNSFIEFFLRGLRTAGKAEGSAEAVVEELEEEDQDCGQTDMDDLKLLAQQIEKRISEIGLNDVRMEASDMTARLALLQRSVTLVIFEFMQTGLFEKDRLTIATLVALKILQDAGELKPLYVDCLLRARAAEDVPPMGDELARWLSESAWARLKAAENDLGKIDQGFENLTEKITSDFEEWEDWYSSISPETRPMPGDAGKLKDLARLYLMRILRPDRLPVALSEYVKYKLGEEFVNVAPFNMLTTYRYSTPRTPILFVLYPGVDPTSWVEDLGRKMGITEKNGLFVNISMGQGQEARADKTIVRLSSKGGWIFLQNVHLMQTWLPTLDEKIANLTTHPNFRVFLSAEPPPLSYMKNIPEGLLQSCICVSNEPPSDLKANLERAWAAFSQERIEKSRKPQNFKACLFGLSFFHSVMLGRRRFGYQGWSRSYGFNTGDLMICADILDSYLSKSASGVIPWQDLRYLFGEIMYGGHITDYFDRRTNNTYLLRVINEDLLKKGQLIENLNSPDPSVYDYAMYSQMISKNLPKETPTIYGLHPNAEVGFLSSKAEDVFQTLLRLDMGTTAVAASSAAAGGSIAAVASGPAIINTTRDIVDDLMRRLPSTFDLVELSERSREAVAAENEDGPYNVVVVQECALMNTLLTEIANSLDELQKGLNGQLNMSQRMEDLTECLDMNLVPGRNPFHACSWERLAWASRKTLVFWFNDLLLRHSQLFSWSNSLQLPYSIWLPGLMNPTSLLTAIKQVTARKNKMPLDKMSLETYVTRMRSPHEAQLAGARPEDGVFVYGLFIEGARWTDEDESLEDQYTVSGTECGGHLMHSRPKVLLCPLPLVYVKAVQVQPTWSPESVGFIRNDPGLYEAPVYLTSMRGNTFVFLSLLRTVDPVHQWVLAGVAVLMQTDD